MRTHDVLQPIGLQVARPEDSSPPWQGIDEQTLLDHCGIELDSPLTLLVLSVHLPAAVQWAENTMHRTVALRTHSWTLRRFPYGYGEIRLPRGKTQSVQSIVYSLNGVSTTLTGPSSSPAGTNYQEDLTDDDGGILMPARGASWPSADIDAIAPVRINFTAGYQAADIPSDIVSAILFDVSSRMQHRDMSDVTGGRYAIDGNTAQLRESLLSPYILNRTY